MIYLALQGFSLIELGILEGIYHATSFLMEVPIEVVADLWGRKTSRISGRVIATLSLATMFLARSFPLQELAFVATALRNNLESGAGDALIYDSMLLDGDAQRYMKIAGRQELVYQTSAIIAFVLGGYLAVHSYTAVFGFSIFFTIVAACSALFFREPIFDKEEKILDPQSSLLRQIGQSMQEQMYHSIVIMNEKGRRDCILHCLLGIAFLFYYCPIFLPAKFLDFTRME